ncbi:MAG: MFS transporter, partial [Bacteroidetes bacterium]|nr:MFS transporter [Bacteroidota bacterium]
GGAIGKLVKKFGERGLIISGIVLLLGGLTFVPHTRSLSTLIVLVTMLAVGSALVTPPLTSLISRYAGTTEYGSVLGVSRSFSSLARVIGPFWGGFILGSAGLSWPFYTGGIMLLVALLLALRVPKIQPELAGDSATSK